MLLSISVNRLFSSQSSRRRRNRRAATAQVELAEPRRCLSATAIADPGIDEAIEAEFVGFDAVWFDDADYAYADLDYDWYPDFDDAQFNFSGDDNSDWVVSDWTEFEGWYEYDTWEFDTWTDAEWIDDGWFSLEEDGFDVDDTWYDFDVVSYDWSDDSFGFDTQWLWYEDSAWSADDEFWSFGDDALVPDEDLEYSFGNDALIPVEDLALFDVFETYEYEYVDVFPDAHAMDEGIFFDVGDGFTYELFFVDDLAVEDSLRADDLSTADGAAFDIDLFDDEFGSGQVIIEQVVFEDEFVFVEVTTFGDNTFFDDGFVEVAAFEDDTFFDDVFVGFATFEDVAFSEVAFVEVGGFEDDVFIEETFAELFGQSFDIEGTDSGSGDQIAEFGDNISELFFDTFTIDTKPVDEFSDDFAVDPTPSDNSPGSEIPTGGLKGGSGGLAEFTTVDDAKSVGGNDLFALNGSVNVASVSFAGPGISETGDSTADTPDVGLNGRSGRPASDVESSARESGRQAFESNRETGSLDALSRRQRDSGRGDRDQPTRRSVDTVLAHRLRSHAQERHVAAADENTQPGRTSSERTMPLVSQSPQRAQQLLTQQSSDEVVAQQRSARSRFDFRMSRAAAQASRLTTQPRSESQDVSYDATLLAFEHPAMSMQLDGLSMPTHDQDRDGVSEIHEGQPGYAQMVSAAGTIAITGAAGVHFTQRRGWSMLLRFVRALLGRI